MRIDRLELKNFRGFESFSRELGPGINVLVGENGTGKTAILDALAIGASSFFNHVPRASPRAILRDDVRVVSRDVGGKIEIVPQYPVELRFEGVIFGQKQRWTRRLGSRKGKTTYAGASEMRTAVLFRWAQSLKEDSTALPVIAYHGAGRLWMKRRIPGSGGAPDSFSRLDGYASCLEAASDEKSFIDWIKAMEWEEFQEGETPPQLAAVRETIRGLVPGCTDLRYRSREGEIIAMFEDGRRLPIRLLSEGFRTVFGLAADLAWRCAALNPHLGEHASQGTPGIVLVDEIDMYLHPNWQRRIIDDLRRSFPQVQFFLTTHSPFIVQSLRSDEVIPLSGPGHLDSPPYKLGVEEVSTEVLGVRDVERSARFREMEEAAQQLTALLDQTEGRDAAKIEAARARYLDLVARYSDDPAFLAVLKAEGALHGVRLDISKGSGPT